MPKIAIINDIHCNYLTLKKALNYLKDKNIDKYIICGDSITDGYENNLVIDTIKKLNPIIINGNRELSIINYNERDWQNSLQYASMLYTYDTLSKENKEYLKTLPTYKITTIAGFKFCISHGSPYHVRDLIKVSDTAIFAKLIKDFNCDIYLFAHTHKPFYKEFKGKTFINVGSFLPAMKKPVATMGILSINNKKINYKLIEINYTAEEIKNYYIGSPLYQKCPEWCNLLIWEYINGIDYCNDFIKYLNKRYKIIDNNTWKIGFPKYMAEKQLDIF